MTPEPDELHDARRSSTNAAVLTLITIAFGVVWLVDPGIPSWVASLWFIVVIPLNLFLLYSARKRYRLLRERAHDGSAE
jgi:membrane protein DedA with SNARE-associated domain